MIYLFGGKFGKYNRTVVKIMSIRPIPATHVAQKIYEIFYEEFGSKARGRFQMTKEQLKLIAGVERLASSRIDHICYDLFEEYGLLMICWGDNYFIIESNKVAAWRKISSKILSKYKVKPVVIKRPKIGFEVEKKMKVYENNQEGNSSVLEIEKTELIDDQLIFSPDFEIEFIEWEYDDQGEKSDGFCDFQEDIANKIDIFNRVVSGFFELGGGCLEWIPEKEFKKSIYGKAIQMIFSLKDGVWYMQTDLYNESDEINKDKKWPIDFEGVQVDKNNYTLSFKDDSEFFESHELAKVRFYLRRKKQD